jgi:hypothetical protein
MLCTLDEEPAAGAWSFFGTCPGGPIVAKKELEVLYGDKLLSASSGKTGRIAFSLKATLGGSGDDGDGDGFPDPDPRTLRTLDHIYLSVGRLRLIDPEPSLSPTCPPPPPPSDGSSSGKRSMDTVAFAEGLELLKSRWPLATRRWSARYAPPTIALPMELEAEQEQGERREEDGPVATFRVDSSRVSWVVKHACSVCIFEYFRDTCHGAAVHVRVSCMWPLQ